MRTLVRISVAAAFAVSLAFIGTVGQTSLQQVNRNLCELWSSLPFLPRYESCEFQNVLVIVWIAISILVACWLLFEALSVALRLYRWIDANWSPKKSTWKGVPVTESDLAAYIRLSPLVQKLDDQIAQIARLPVHPDKTVAFPEQETARFLGIPDIAKLDALLEENQEAVLRLSSYSFTDDYISRGASVRCLFGVLGVQLGETGLRELNRLCQLSRITEHGIQNRLNAYREFSKNHKITIRVPLVPDFNLVPIEEGLSIARRQCRQSAFAKSLAKGGSKESELLAYLERLKNTMAFYGKLRGRNERAPLGVWPQSEELQSFPLSSAMLNPRFEAGKIIVDSQLFGQNSKGELTVTNVIYDRLYVLRPNLMHAIEQLKGTKA